LFRECHQHRDDDQNEFHQNSEYDTEKIFIETLRNNIKSILDKFIFNIIVYVIDPLSDWVIDCFTDSLIEWSIAWGMDGSQWNKKLSNDRKIFPKILTNIW
jgi:hypothetical protein